MHRFPEDQTQQAVERLPADLLVPDDRPTRARVAHCSGRRVGVGVEQMMVRLVTLLTASMIKVAHPVLGQVLPSSSCGEDGNREKALPRCVDQMNEQDGSPSTPEDTSFDLPIVPAIQASPERIRRAWLLALQERFPYLCAWYGQSTRHWWALLGGQLVEQETADALARQVARWRAGDPL